MKKIILFFLLAGLLSSAYTQPPRTAASPLVVASPTSWIRINQLGYPPTGPKTAVLGSKIAAPLAGAAPAVTPGTASRPLASDASTRFELVDATTGNTVFTAPIGRNFGAYGPFTDTRRLDFSAFRGNGIFFLRVGKTLSPTFSINAEVYDGAADFCLRYMRQQRSGFNPFLKDSCHTHDGYTLYAPVPDSTHIDVVGGWHDASDYLQYSTTTSNAVYHLLAAWRDFPGVFGDHHQTNGLDGGNHVPDILDEARWGLDWMLKMHPKDDWLFNQVGDDRDHKGMRIPKEDTNFYGRGLERPVYFCTGQPQVRGKFMNATTGVASTAGKFSAAFSLGAQLFKETDTRYALHLLVRSATALSLGEDKPGVCQTASVLSPYIYAEENWTDDMELACAAWGSLKEATNPGDPILNAAYQYAKREPITPWLGKDTANHYQWYPFINLGHYELAKLLHDKRRDTLIDFYRQGIDKVWQKAKANAFYRAIPFIWCSNNLTVSFAIQCYWYRRLTGDTTYQALEAACFDWLFGCNPWGTSMVYGLPATGDTPTDPHSAFTHIGHYPIDGGLVDGPVYTSIYDHLIGIRLTHEDTYKDLQSGLAVYHDDYGDYSTNEPTMDGTASLIYLLASRQAEAAPPHVTISHGGIVRGDSTKKNIALVFTGDEFGEGIPAITTALKKHRVHGSFFFTGRFYRNPSFRSALLQLKKDQHYLGPHSDAHLLYNDWNDRDSLLVTFPQFRSDLEKNRTAIHALGIDTIGHYYIPPYEWWNDTIARWARSIGWQIINFTPGIRTNADYTWPEMGASYKTTDQILASLKEFETSRPGKLNGAIILIHAGVDPRRKDRLYNRLDELITWLQAKGYRCRRVDELL